MNLNISKLRFTPVELSIVLSAISALATILAFNYGLKFGVLAGIFLIGLPAAIAIIIFPRFGVIVMLVVAYLIMGVSRFGIDFPLGTVMDGILLLLIFGFFLSQKITPNWGIFNNPTTFLILVWIFYNLMQFFNTAAESHLAWVYTIRSVAAVMLSYFIFMKHIRSLKFIKLLFKIWIFLAFLGALYTFKQEFFGFSQFEKDWLATDAEGYYRLYFIAGRWRKFSFFTDPVSLSYNMVMGAVLCIVLLLNPARFYKKVILCVLIVIFMVAMVYSGTRAAFPLVPITLFLLAILKMNYKVLISVGVGLLIFVGLIFAPIYTPNMMRFQSAFRPNNDPSYNLRQDNQKFIQPFIQSHPFGGGLGSVGMWGARFSPNSYLSSFQPDSGYVRVAVELGWVGLFIIICLG
ncbi:MAG: O-antigen ligase domain-containing protein, partial [Sphingobacteriales bacterium]